MESIVLSQYVSEDKVFFQSSILGPTECYYLSDQRIDKSVGCGDLILCIFTKKVYEMAND